MEEQFKEWREEIAGFLKIFLEKKKSDFVRIHNLGKDGVERLLDFALNGKMIRGCMSCLGYALIKPEIPDTVFAVAAAMELFQSALLVHDDIMDRDQMRRGAPSLYYQYVRRLSNEAIANPDHTAEALGICVGDVAFFLAFELLAVQKIQADTLRTVMGECSRELSFVGEAQMADVYNGAKTGIEGIGNDEILNVYLYKTGRYTFSLPLKIGALLAGAEAAFLEMLSKLGEQLGVLFQLKDDELGLFGNESAIGKPVGSDISEGKKTLYYVYLMEHADTAQIQRLKGIFGNPGIGDDEIRYVQNLARNLGAQDAVERLKSGYADRAGDIIKTLTGVNERNSGILSKLLLYSLNRDK